MWNIGSFSFERHRALVARGESAVTRGLVLFCVPKENQKSTRFARLCAGQSAVAVRLIVLF